MRTYACCARLVRFILSVCFYSLYESLEVGWIVDVRHSWFGCEKLKKGGVSTRSEGGKRLYSSDNPSSAFVDVPPSNSVSLGAC